MDRRSLIVQSAAAMMMGPGIELPWPFGPAQWFGGGSRRVVKDGSVVQIKMASVPASDTAPAESFEYLAIMEVTDGPYLSYMCLQRQRGAHGGLKLIVSSQDKPGENKPIEWGEAVTFKYFDQDNTEYMLTHSDNAEVIIRFDAKLRAPENVRFAFERGPDPTSQVTEGQSLFVRATYPNYYWYRCSYFQSHGERPPCPFGDYRKCPPAEDGDIVHQGDVTHRQYLKLELV